MTSLQSLAILLSSSGLLYLVFNLVKFLYKVWWSPMEIQSFMASQGVRGPSYQFMYGTTKAMFRMRKESLAKPMNPLSHDIVSNVHPHFYSWFQKYGDNFLHWLGPRPSLVVTDPSMIKEILEDKQKTYPKGKPEDYEKLLFGSGFINSKGQKWVNMRKIANHTFHSESLKNMIPAMIVSTEMMLERWEQCRCMEIEVYEEFKLFTSEVISRTAFGSSYTEGKNIFELLSKLTSLIPSYALKLRLPVISKVLKSSVVREAENLEKGIKQSILKIVKKREETAKGEADNFGSDFLGSLLKACYDDDDLKKISLDELVDECKTFYIAGQETTNSLLSWTILLLSIHTDWQEKARKEVLNIFGHRTPNSDGIAKLKTMSMIISETLRLYPPVPVFHRETDREVRLGKLTLPAHMKLDIPTLLLHHDTRTWGEDAHLFKPERFSEGFAKATNNTTAAYLPFGMGPRICVGYDFATIEAKIALSMILQNYSFTLAPCYAHSPHQVITIIPQHGLQVVLQSLKIKD